MQRPGQAEFERSVFLHFAAAAGLDLAAGSIESREPPEPDIWADIVGVGPVAYELTELIDNDFRQRWSVAEETQKFIRSNWKRVLPAADAEAFSNRFGHAIVFFRYRNDAALRTRKRNLPSALSALLAQPNGYEGRLLGLPEFEDILEEVIVHRGAFVGPVLDVDSSGFLGDPTASACRKKFGKRYQTDCPIELVAHIELNLLPPEEQWMSAIDDLKVELKDSLFRKVWVFDRSARAVLHTLE